jgi:predicted ester cyclase
MTPTPDAVARDWFENVWNNLDESSIDRLMHPEGVVHGLGPQPTRGPEGFKPFFRVFKNSLRGIQVHVERSVVEGDTAALLCHVVANHAGDGLGPASGKNVDFWGITMVRVKDGRLVEGWNSFDFLTMYQQMGWVGNPVTPQRVAD